MIETDKTIINIELNNESLVEDWNSYRIKSIFLKTFIVNT